MIQQSEIHYFMEDMMMKKVHVLISVIALMLLLSGCEKNEWKDLAGTYTSFAAYNTETLYQVGPEEFKCTIEKDGSAMIEYSLAVGPGTDIITGTAEKEGEVQYFEMHSEVSDTDCKLWLSVRDGYIEVITENRGLTWYLSKDGKAPEGFFD